MKRTLTSILLILVSWSGFSQTDNFGTEFWTGFMQNYVGGMTNELRLYICAQQTTDVTISMPLLSYSQKVNIIKDSVKVVTIPTNLGYIKSSEVVEKTGIHIVADYPVSVALFNLYPATTDASVVFPLKNIPVNPSYVTGHPDASSYSNEILLVSPENGVEVEITPTAKTQGGQTGKFTITLNKGETYQIKGQTSMDGSEVKVTNDKRIIVYSGDVCSNFPCGACDHQVEQVFPDELLDTAYYAIPQFGHKNGYVIKVINKDTALVIKVNGKPYKIGSKKSIKLDVPSGDSVLHITSTGRFSCFQFLKGVNCNGYITKQFGDPSILQLISTKYMAQKSIFSTVDSKSLKNGDHFVSILIPTTAKNEVFLDGTKISPGEFIEVSHNTSFSYAKIKLTMGTHTLVCDKGHIAYCYGISNAESYLYLAGFSLPNFEINIKDTALSYNCKDNKVTMQFKAVLQGAIKKYRWDFGDGTSDSTAIVKHSYEMNKEFTIKLWAMGANDKVDSIIKKFTFKWPEFNPVFDKLLCDEKITYEEKNPFFTNFKWHDNSTKNSYTSSNTEKIWVTATDSTGYCKFGDTAQVSKVDVFSKIFVDTLSNCHLNNLFKFVDSSGVKNDLIKYKVWNFPGGVTKYDTSNFYYSFRQPGKLMVYLDIYPLNSPCKARVEIPVTVNWNTDIDGYIDKEKYCHGDTAILTDASFSCCQKVKTRYWELQNGTKASSNNNVVKLKVLFDYKNENGIFNYNYITETEQGCRDTLKSGLIVWPAAKSDFTLGPDTMKCLALSRWTFTHNVAEQLTGPYSMLWDFGNGKTGTQNQYRNFRYVDTGRYKVTFKTVTDIGCKDSTSKYVTVLPQPKARFTVNDSVQCLKNNSFILKDSSGLSFVKYGWNFGNGVKSTNNINNITYGKEGKYRVSLYLTAPYPGCDDSTWRIMEILRQPKPDFSINSDTQCAYNNSIVLTDKSIFYNGKGKYYWSYNSNLDSSEVPNPIQDTKIGNHKISLQIIDSMNCSDTISKNIFIRSEPDVNFSINDTVQCFGKNQFILSGNSSDNIKTYTWKLNNAIIDKDDKAELIDLAPFGKYKITLSLTNEVGCEDSVTRWVEVLPPFKADFTMKDTQCFSNGGVNIAGKTILPKDIINVLTYTEGSNVIGTVLDINDYKFSTPGNKRIKLYIETINGCKDSSSKPIFLAPDPTATFKSDSVCLGENIILTAIQTAGAPLISWAFDFGDGSRYDNIPVNSDGHTYKNAGTYYPTVSFNNRLGCSGFFAGSPIVVYSLPKSEFRFKILASDKENTIVKLIPAELGYKSYLWSFPDGSTNTNDSPTVNFTRFFKDSVKLRVETIHGCKDGSSGYLYIYPPLENVWVETAFSPNGDDLNDVFKPGNIEGVTSYDLMIFDRWGEMLFQSNNPLLGWDGTYQGVPVQMGVYAFQVQFMYADGNRYSSKGNVTVVK